MPHSDPDPRTDSHARLLRGWMADKGLKAPSLALSIERHGEQIGADYIRKLARGERELSGVALPLREAIRKALRVPAEVWESQTGLATAEPQVYGSASWNGADRRDNLTLEISRDDLMKLQSHKLYDSPSGSHATLVDIVSIPVYGTASAGSPGSFLAEDNILYHVPVEKKHIRNGNTIAVAVNGNSMLPRIQDGDIVIVDRSINELQEGKVFLVLIDGQGACVKRARHSRGQWWLWSDNADHAPFQAEEATVIGMGYRVQRPSENL